MTARVNARPIDGSLPETDIQAQHPAVSPPVTPRNRQHHTVNAASSQAGDASLRQSSPRKKGKTGVDVDSPLGQTRPLVTMQPGVDYFVWKSVPSKSSEPSIPVPPSSSSSETKHGNSDSNAVLNSANSTGGCATTKVQTSKRKTPKFTIEREGGSKPSNRQQQKSSTAQQLQTAVFHAESDVDQFHNIDDVSVEQIRNFIVHRKAGLRAELKLIKKRKVINEEQVQAIQAEKDRLPYAIPHLNSFDKIDHMGETAKRQWAHAIRLYRIYKSAGLLHTASLPSTPMSPSIRSTLPLANRTYHATSASISETMQRMKDALRIRISRSQRSGMPADPKHNEQIHLLNSFSTSSNFPTESEMARLPVQEQILWESIFADAEALDARDGNGKRSSEHS